VQIAVAVPLRQLQNLLLQMGHLGLLLFECGLPGGRGLDARLVGLLMLLARLLKVCLRLAHVLGPLRVLLEGNVRGDGKESRVERRQDPEGRSIAQMNQSRRISFGTQIVRVRLAQMGDRHNNSQR